MQRTLTATNQELTIIVSRRSGTPKVPNYPMPRVIFGTSVSGGHKNRELDLQVEVWVSGWQPLPIHHMSQNVTNSRPRTYIGLLRHTPPT